MQVRRDVVEKVARNLANIKEFTILATLRQQERSIGSIITISSLFHERLEQFTYYIFDINFFIQ